MFFPYKFFVLLATTLPEGNTYIYIDRHSHRLNRERILYCTCKTERPAGGMARHYAVTLYHIEYVYVSLLFLRKNVYNRKDQDILAQYEI